MKFHLILLFLVSALCLDINAQVRINEVYAWSVDNELPSDSFKINDWIELFNEGETDYKLDGHFLTDNAKKVDKWKFPNGVVIKAGEYLIVWADGIDSGLHTNFKLNWAGETLVLSSHKKKAIDKFSFEQSENRWSAGIDDVEKSIGYSPLPSPRQQNKYHKTRNQHQPLIQNNPAGRFRNISLSCENKSCKLIYSFGGIDPLKEMIPYTGTIRIMETTAISVRCIHDDYAPSRISSELIFANDPILARNKNMQIFSLHVDDEELYDPVRGIYVEGTNGVKRIGKVIGNFHQEWEVPAQLIVYDTTGKSVLNQKIGIQITGLVAAVYKQKPFALFARKKYGKSAFDYQFFDDKAINDYKNIILRNSGGADGNKTLIRDAFVTTLTRQNTDIMYQAYRPVIVYVNGLYFGILNLREKLNEEYLSSNTGIHEDSLNMIEHFRKVYATHGSSKEIKSLLDTLENSSKPDYELFNLVANTIDIDDHIDYHIFEMFAANSDWPANNVRMWKSNRPDSKWKHIIFDMDASWGMFESLDRSYFFNPFEWMENKKETKFWNMPFSTAIYRTCINSSSYREEFIQRFAAHLNTSFNEDYMIGLIDSFANNIKTEIPYHANAWPPFKSVKHWEQKVQLLRNFASNRPSVIRGMILEHFNLPSTARITFMSEPSGAGNVIVNGLDRPCKNLSGAYFKKIPIKLQAQAKEGYQFSHWEHNGSKDPSYQFTVKSDVALKAVFIKSK